MRGTGMWCGKGDCSLRSMLTRMAATLHASLVACDDGTVASKAPPSVIFSGRQLCRAVLGLATERIHDVGGRKAHSMYGPSARPLVEVLRLAEEDGLLALCHPSGTSPALSPSAAVEGALGLLLQKLHRGLQPNHSMTYCCDARHGDLEKAAVNALAAALGLPDRFHWHRQTFLPNEESGCVVGPRDHPVRLSGEPATGVAKFLWEPVVRSATGDLMMKSATTTTSPPLLPTHPGEDTPAVFSFRRESPSCAPGAGGKASIAADTGASSSNTITGGGVLHSSSLESYMALFHTVRTQALTRCRSSFFASSEDDSRHLQRLTMYCSDQVDPQLLRVARLMGMPHIRILPTVMNPSTRSFSVMFAEVRQKVAEDLAVGLFPCLIVGVFGSVISGAIDPLVEMAVFCGRTGVWFHVDASQGGIALLAPRRHCEGGEGAPTDGWVEAARVFDEAIQWADSVYLSTRNSYLPFQLIPTTSCADGGGGASLLYLAHTAKLSVALRELPDGGGSHANTNRLHSTAHVDAMHLLPLPERGIATLSLALHLVSFGSSWKARMQAVRCHQLLTWRVHQRIAADGRFDVALRGTYFGAVYMRWLTLSDEATERLARAWVGVLEGRERTAAATPSAAAVPVRIYVGLAVIQKRLWLTVSFSFAQEASPPPSGAADDEVSTFILSTLKEAAAIVCSLTAEGPRNADG